MGALLTSSVLIVLGVVPVCGRPRHHGRLRDRPPAHPGSRALFILFLLGLTLPLAGIIIPLYYLVRGPRLLRHEARHHPAAHRPLHAVRRVLDARPLPEHAVRAVGGRPRRRGHHLRDLFWRIHVPLARPAVASLAILLAVWTWNQFLLALVLVENPTERTMAGALGAFQGQYATDIPLLHGRVAGHPHADAHRLPDLPAPVHLGAAAGLAQGLSAITVLAAPDRSCLTYPDSLGGDLASLRRLLDGPLRRALRRRPRAAAVPVLGRSRLRAADLRARSTPRFGTWADMRRPRRATTTCVLDLMVNHISRQSPEFRDFERHGRTLAPVPTCSSPLDKVWPDGRPPADDVARIFLRKPVRPLLDHHHRRHGRADGGLDHVRDSANGPSRWTWTFGPTAQARLIARLARRLRPAGRPDRPPGRRGLRGQEGRHELLHGRARDLGGARLAPRDRGRRLGLVVLPEVHDVYADPREARRARLLDLRLRAAGLLLLAFETGDATRLAAHLAALAGAPVHDPRLPRRHPGATPTWMASSNRPRCRACADVILERGGNVNRILSDAHTRRRRRAPAQLHLLLRPARGRRALPRRASHPAVRARASRRSTTWACSRVPTTTRRWRGPGEGRAINRHDYTPAEIEAALGRPVVRRLLELVRLRATHPAFDAPLAAEVPGPSMLRLARGSGSVRCDLEVDLASGTFHLDHRG